MEDPKTQLDASKYMEQILEVYNELCDMVGNRFGGKYPAIVVFHSMVSMLITLAVYMKKDMNWCIEYMKKTEEIVNKYKKNIADKTEMN